MSPALDLATSVREAPHPGLAPALARFASLRHRLIALRRGDYRELLVASQQLAFARVSGDERVIVALDASDHVVAVTIPAPLPDARTAVDLLNGDEAFPLDDGKLRLTPPPHRARIMVVRCSSGFPRRAPIGIMPGRTATDTLRRRSMNMDQIIDLRSDTVTLPSPEMRQAIADAALGDDVYGEDPTVRALEERAAALLGKEAGLFVPTGTMGNLLAVLTHCRAGDELICGRGTHTYASEGGGSARFGGVTTWTVSQTRGRLDPAEVAAAIHPDDSHYTRSRLLIVEQPHGGWVMPLAELAAVTKVARDRGLRVHMDGARLFNAAIALGVPASAIAGYADTAQFCVSKGLAAPVGSLLVGPADFIAEARRNRKAVGGGMRQAGIVAAAGLYAVDHMVARLAEDHANARHLAAGLRDLGWTIDREEVETNIFFCEPPAGADPKALAAALKAQNIMVSSPYVGSRMRLVTHYGITEGEIERALATFAAVGAGATVGASA